MKQLLTVAEAAALVKRSGQTIYRWIDTNKLRSFEGENGQMVRAADVQKVASTTRRGRPRQ